MKFTKIIVLVIFTALITLAGCKSESRKDLIVKKWKFTESSESRMKKEDLDKLVLEFTKDGKYSVAKETGTYLVTDDGKYFIVTDGQSGNVDTNIINELTAARLKFTVKAKGITITAVPSAN